MATLEVSVVAGADDGYSDSAGGFTPALNNNVVGNISAVFDMWLRFLNVTVPVGATITSAYLEVYGFHNVNSIDVVSNIYANDADDATLPTTRATHEAKARTTAFTAWDNPAAWSGATRQSDDLSAVIQEVVDRPGWASGNALMILWDDDGSPAGPDNRLHASSYEHATHPAPLLHIEYTEPASGAGNLLLMGVG